MDLSQLHFLRPEWLLALLPWLAGLVIFWRRRANGGIWEKVIDPQLLPHVLSGHSLGKQRRLVIWLAAMAVALMIIAQAGPVWQKRPQPLFKQKSALVIALDLSRSMDATDLRPSRLARARFKVNDILARRKDGQTALLVWAGSAFTVTPLTDDVKTIASLVPSLSTGMMPAQGSRADRAIEKAVQLMKNAGQVHGDILLLTDGAGGDAEDAFRKARQEGYRVSVLAIGTTDGAPVPLPGGGFLKDNSGAIVVPKLDVSKLQQLAQLGGGRFSQLTPDDRDVNYLLQPINQQHLNMKGKKTKLNTDVWYEEGPWLLLLALPLAALLFRRGELFLLLVFLLPVPRQAQAFEWQDLWLNQDQQAQKLLQDKQSRAAAKKFRDPAWKAAAEYRSGNYQEAVKQLQHYDTSDSWYNRGNALARSGQLQQAINAYDQALKKDPHNKDASYNRDLVKKQLQQQQKPSNPQQQSSSKDQKQQQGKNTGKQQPSSGDQSKQAQQKQQPQQGKQSSSPDKKPSQGQSSQQNPQQQPKEKQTQQGQAGKQPEQKPPEQQQKQPAQQAAQQQEQKQSSEQPPSNMNALQQQKPETPEQRATEQWLRRIPDDPGGLLRRKFRYQYQQQKQNSEEQQDW